MPNNITDKFTIRLFTMDDYDEVCRIVAQLDKLHRDVYPHYFREAFPTRERDYLETFVTDDERAMFVAEQDGKLGGSIAVEVRHAANIPILQPHSYVQIDELIVDEEARGSGIGQALMQAAHEWGQARGITEFNVGVYAFNEDAIRFYKKLGYEISRHVMVRNLPRN